MKNANKAQNQVNDVSNQNAERLILDGVQLIDDERYYDAINYFESLTQALKYEYSDPWRFMGQAYAALHLGKKALKYYDVAINIAQKKKRIIKAIQSMRDKSITCSHLLFYDEAVRLLEKGVELIEKGIDIKEITTANYYHSYGIVLSLRGNNEKAKECFNKSLMIFKNKKDIYGMIISYVWIIRLLIKQKQYLTALQLFQKAKDETKDHLQSYVFDIESATLLFNVGDISSSQKRVEELLGDKGYLNKATKNIYLENVSEALSDLYILEGRLHLTKMHFDKALLSFAKANEYAPASMKTSVWLIYAKFMTALYSTKTIKNEYICDIKQMSIVGMELEKTIKAYKNKMSSNDIAKLYFWLGLIYYKLEDFINAEKYLILSNDFYRMPVTRGKSLSYGFRLLFKNTRTALKLLIKDVRKGITGYPEAKIFLNHIWNRKISPTWLEWWFNSPKYTGRLVKRIIGAFLMSGLLFELALLILIQVHTIDKSEWGIFGITIVTLLLLLFSPLMNRFKAANVEIDITLANQVLSPVLIDMEFDTEEVMKY
jgi:tetratricopeptide (TPR) repeat protein